jgi:hypothetical protein
MKAWIEDDSDKCLQAAWSSVHHTTGMPSSYSTRFQGVSANICSLGGPSPGSCALLAS